METLKYVYKPKIVNMTLGLLLFGVGSVFAYRHAMANDRGVIINHMITLDTDQATLFYWGLFAVSVLFALGAAAGVVKGMISTQTLTMDDTTLRLPRAGLRSDMVTVAYRDITNMTMLQIRSERFLTVEYKGGKVNISRSMLPGDAIFEKVCNALAERVHAARYVAVKD